MSRNLYIHSPYGGNVYDIAPGSRSQSMNTSLDTSLASEASDTESRDREQIYKLSEWFRVSGYSAASSIAMAMNYFQDQKRFNDNSDASMKLVIELYLAKKTIPRKIYCTPSKLEPSARPRPIINH